MTPKEVRKEWAAALRSGKYEQAHATLRNGNGYCCLGVLCDLYPDGEWVDDYEYRIGDTLSQNFLPIPVQEWAGLRQFNGGFSPNENVPQGNHSHFVLTSLTLMNDNGCTFEQIADVIEQELPGLVKE